MTISKIEYSNSALNQAYTSFCSQNIQFNFGKKLFYLRYVYSLDVFRNQSFCRVTHSQNDKMPEMVEKSTLNQTDETSCYENQVIFNSKLHFKITCDYKVLTETVDLKKGEKNKTR